MARQREWPAIDAKPGGRGESRSLWSAVSVGVRRLKLCVGAFCGLRERGRFSLPPLPPLLLLSSPPPPSLSHAHRKVKFKAIQIATRDTWLLLFPFFARSFRLGFGNCLIERERVRDEGGGGKNETRANGRALLTQSSPLRSLWLSFFPNDACPSPRDIVWIPPPRPVGNDLNETRGEREFYDRLSSRRRLHRNGQR